MERWGGGGELLCLKPHDNFQVPAVWGQAAPVRSQTSSRHQSEYCQQGIYQVITRTLFNTDTPV